MLRQLSSPEASWFLKGDITKQEVDVIVHAANSTLLGRRCVDGAIHARRTTDSGSHVVRYAAPVHAGYLLARLC